MNCSVLNHEKKDNGFYTMTKIKRGNIVCDNRMPEMNWYRFDTPQWLRKYWNNGTKTFVGGKTPMYRFVARLPHCMGGKYIFVPRSMLNRIGNINTYEYLIQDENGDPTKINKKLTSPPPEGFIPTVDPPCNFCSHECIKAQEEKDACCALWIQKMKEQNEQKRQQL